MHSVNISICPFAVVCTWFLTWISEQLCIHVYYVISYSGPTHFELSWHEMHIGKYNQNCGEECWEDMHCEKRLVNRMFQSMQFLNAFFLLLANVHGCMWTVSTGVRQIPSYDSYQLSPTNVGSSLLWLICQSGGWFFNHSLIKSIIASFAPGHAVIALMRCAPALNATIGHWMKKGLRLSAVAGLPEACWAIRFFLVFKWGHTWLPNSEFEAIWNQLKS